MTHSTDVNTYYRWWLQIADYKAPNFEAGGAMQQGMYVPKPELWEKLYDPLYVMLRAMYKKDFQASMDRYTA